jgi:urease accessory protein
VGTDATLVWLPEPVIAAHRCDHHSATHIDLDPGARLLVREELLLGRHAEPPGTIRQRLRVTRGHQPLHDQELTAGPGVPGWQGPAVTGGRRALGSLLLVDPHRWADPDALPVATTDTDLALLPLGGPALLITALADDATTLRGRLDVALAAVGRDPGRARGIRQPEQHVLSRSR